MAGGTASVAGRITLKRIRTDQPENGLDGSSGSRRINSVCRYRQKQESQRVALTAVPARNRSVLIRSIRSIRSRVSARGFRLQPVAGGPNLESRSLVFRGKNRDCPLLRV